VALTPGTRIGSFEIAAKIGEGGMGEVYRATDTKLGREVAIKVLPEAFAIDAERVARFDREARTLASLNHPGIAQIYGIEDVLSTGSGQAGAKALVMELVEGPTLADRIVQGAMPVDEVLSIARQIAEALEAAHEQGVIHRDLKPANIKLRPDGTVKILDFGLAKAMEPAAALSPGSSFSPTITTPAMTQAGLILGTAAYMSPEQARGKAVDTRADVWAYGAVLFEMLSGRRPFDGEDITEVLGAVVRLDPDWNQLPAGTPPRIRSLLRACLQKNPRQRLAHVQDARLMLDGTFHEGIEQAADHLTAAPAPLPQPWWRRVLPLVATALVVGTLAAGAAWMARAPRPGAVVRSTHLLPEGRGFFNPGRGIVAISPDGRQLVYNGSDGVYVRSMDGLVDRLVAGTDGFASSPFFSPDGQSLGYFSQTLQEARRVPIAGGTPLSLASVGAPFGASWEEDGTILYGQVNGIWEVSENGGEPRRIIELGPGELPFAPHRLPRSDWVLFTLADQTLGSARWDEGDMVVESPSSGERRLVRSGGSDARYVPTGHLVFAQGAVLYAQAFDLDRLEVTGGAVPVVPGVRRALNPASNTGAAHYDFSNDGTLVYVPGSESGRVAATLVWVDELGRREALDLPPGQYEHPRVSPDGEWLAVERLDGEATDIWLYEISGGAAERRLTEGGNNRFPAWSSDGEYVVFQTDREGDAAVFRQRADGTGGVERLTTPDEGTEHVPEDWSPAGDRLAISVVSPDGVELWMWTPADGAMERYGTLRSTVPFDVTFSPDGVWIAYTDRSGSVASYVQAVGSPGARYQVGRDDDLAHHPLWSPDARRLIYFPGGNAAAVSVEILRTSPSVELGRPEPLPGDGLPLNVQPTSLLNHDVGPDGRFVTVIDGSGAGGEAPADQIVIVQHWFEELKRLVPVE
jgi:serine/threonine-protein kinase